jgi:hypothetical protein
MPSLFDGYVLNKKEALDRMDFWLHLIDEGLNKPFMFREPMRQATDNVKTLVKLLKREEEDR